MGTVNRLSNLLDKIERRLGVRYIIEHNPELGKEAWAEVILDDTMDTFSRYFPNREIIYLNSDVCRYDPSGYYLISEDILDPLDIIGVGDIAWSDYRMQNTSNYLNAGIYDQYATTMSFSDVAMVQTSANLSSMFNTGIFVKFEEPNKLKISGVNNRNILQGFANLPLNIFIKHKSLTTISPTKMELFEKLATSDVAKYLIGELKYFDSYETNYGNIDLKLDDLREESNRRESIIEEFEAGYINPANDFQPMIMTI